MIVRYMITCFGTTFETFTEIESLQGPTTLYGRLRRNTNICILQKNIQSKAVLFIFVLFTRFYFQSLLPETMLLLLPTNVRIYKWVFPKFILGIYNAHAHAL